MTKEAQQRPLGIAGKIALVLLVFAASTFYMMNVSAISARGYDLAALERDVEELKRENQRLQFEIAKHQSMASIEARLPDLELVAADGVEYVDAGRAIVARR